MTKYPVVKMKHLRNYTIGDVVRLKKNGKLVEIAKHISYTGSCKRCVFGDQCIYVGELDYKLLLFYKNMTVTLKNFLVYQHIFYYVNSLHELLVRPKLLFFLPFGYTGDIVTGKQIGRAHV